MANMTNSRDLLTAIGVGQFNATMVIPYMMIAPATTDPKAGQIILLVQHIQKALFDMGAHDVPMSGRLDVATARALEQVVGPGWERTTWGGNVAAILAAKQMGMALGPGSAMGAYEGDGLVAGRALTSPLSGPLDFLPDVPGGILTYGVAAYFLWKHFSKRRTA